MKDLIVIGASGHGKVLENIARTMNKWNKICFLDDDTTKQDQQTLGSIQEFYKYIASCEFIIGIGDNADREKVHNMLESHNATFTTLIHPFSSIGSNVQIDIGTVIMPGVVVNCNTFIGKGCILNTGACIDHDCRIDNLVHISPGAVLGGSVNIKTRTWLGLGSRVVNNISVTNDCKIGAGAVVIKDIIEPGTYVGIPAYKIIKK